MRAAVLVAFALTGCMARSGQREWKPLLVVPLTLEASYVIRTECVIPQYMVGPVLTEVNTDNVALDYGASGSSTSRTDSNGFTTFAATSVQNLRYFSCPDAVVARLEKVSK